MVILAVLSLALWLGVAAQLFWVAPQARRVFEEFQMQIPWLTRQVVHEFWWVAPACLVAGLVISLTARSHGVWFLLMVVLPLILNILVCLSLYLPYKELLESLGPAVPKV
jgi:type II secretory pathway component PulF